MAGSILNTHRIPEFLIYPHPSNSAKLYKIGSVDAHRAWFQTRTRKTGK